MTPKEVLLSVVGTATKMILSRPVAPYRVDLLLTENYLIIYTHSKGNHWNISGNHYRYWHDIKTGEFISEGHLPSGYSKERIIAKERFLVADYEMCKKLREGKN